MSDLCTYLHLQVDVLCAMTPCSAVARHQHSRGPWYLHLQGLMHSSWLACICFSRIFDRLTKTTKCFRHRILSSGPLQVRVMHYVLIYFNLLIRNKHISPAHTQNWPPLCVLWFSLVLRSNCWDDTLK